MTSRHPRDEYRRLLAVGVNPRAAETIACGLYSRHERALAEATRRYAALHEARRPHRATRRAA